MLSGATTPSESRPGSNANESVLHIPQSSRAGDIRYFNIIFWTLVVGGVLPLSRNEVWVFYTRNQQGQLVFFLCKHTYTLANRVTYDSLYHLAHI